MKEMKCIINFTVFKFWIKFLKKIFLIYRFMERTVVSRSGTETDGETDQHISSATQPADEEATDIFNVPET